MKEICIVAGGAGFIGSHLCQKLIENDYKVVCIDNLSSGRLENLAKIIDKQDFTFIKHDLIDEFDYDLIHSLNNAHYIFHLASPASPNSKSPISYYQRPVETLLVNSYGTYKLLEVVKKTKAKFLFASTSEIYGDPLIHPQNEDYWGNVNPIGERSCYDEAKRFGESITYSYIRKYHVDARIIRIFNTYGPNMNKEDGRAVVEFIIKALKETSIPIFGKGIQTRSFCYVSDMVTGIYKAMFSQNTNGEVINLGNDKEFTILSLAQLIKELTGSKSALSFENLPLDDPKRRKPDIQKAKKLLNWQPEVSLKDGLIKTIDYFRNYK